MNRATRAVEELLGDYQHVIEDFRLVMGSGGAFEFKVDGELLYSKKSMQRRHAEPGELLELFRQVVGPEVPIYK